MADRKISDMTALAAGSQATGDLIAVVDVSEAAAANKNKKMTMEDLFKGIPGNVGVGTSSPSNTAGFSQQLEVAGNLACVSINNTGTGARKYSIGVTGAGALGFWDNTNSAYRIFVDSSGQVGIGTTSPLSKLNTLGTQGNWRIDPDSVSGEIQALATTTDNSGFIDYRIRTNQTMFDSGGSERARIDSSGRLLVGASTARTYSTGGAGGNHLLQLETAGATSVFTTAGIYSNSDAADIGAYFELGRSKGTTLGSVTAVANNDALGEIRFTGTNGSGSNQAASIRGEVDGTVSGGGANDMPGRLVFSTTADGASSPTERMRISQNGNVKIQTRITNNTDDTSYAIDLGGSSSISTNNGAGLRISYSNGFSTAVENIAFRSNSTPGGSASNFTVANIATTHGGAFVNPFLAINIDDGTQGNLVTRLTCTKTGVTVNGAFSKTSGSFRIDHPLESKKATHDLVHSFIEGPQADNIYRGQVNLVNGAATVNLDTAADMTEGTFVLLNTNISCFTSNESDWTAVRGSVSGNVLTIEAQDNTSTATVSWLVIGERHDQHMLDTDWTDENGRVITEPLKSSDEMNPIETP